MTGQNINQNIIFMLSKLVLNDSHRRDRFHNFREHNIREQ